MPISSGDRVKQTAEAEHIGPDYTGDNISAKKVAGYIWNGTTWERNTGASTNTLVTVPYDAITYTNTSTTVDTYRYYTGGTGGTLVATVTVTYSDPTTKAVLVSVVRT